MATLDDTYAAMETLMGNGLGFDVDAVMNESATNLLKSQGKANPTSAEIQAVVDVWTKNPDGSAKTDVKRFYKIKLGEVCAKYDAVQKSLANIPTEFSGITATASSATASAAAAPMFVAIKNEVLNNCNMLADALKVCCELNVGAPQALLSLVDTLATCKSLVGA